MAYTLITLSLIGLVLLFWLYRLMKGCFCRSFCIWKNQKDGSVFYKEATILSVNTIKAGKRPLLELLILFDNLAGCPIHRKIRVWDSKPQLDRFQIDKTIPIALNVAKRPKGPVFLALGECRISFAYVVFCCFIVVLYVVGCYFLMGESLSHINSAPEKYELLLKKSDVWQMGLIYLGVSIFLYFLLNRVGLLVDGKTRAKNWDLLYMGKRASAVVRKHWETGTMVNNNPVVGFNYTFKDRTGRVFGGSDKKAVGKKEMVTLSEVESLDIMYLPKDPTVSRLTENLENESFSKFTDFVFLFVMFIFSVILVGAFCYNIFGAWL